MFLFMSTTLRLCLSGTIDPTELKVCIIPAAIALPTVCKWTCECAFLYIQQAMQSLGYDVKNPLVFQILSNLDKNGKQMIDFEEFLDMMTARMVCYA